MISILLHSGINFYNNNIALLILWLALLIKNDSEQEPKHVVEGSNVRTSY